MATADSSAWTRNFFPREGDGVGFDRAVFFSDAVFAIALTLAAVEIGIPEVDAEQVGSVSAMWDAIQDKFPAIVGFLVAFAVVAFYWRANHAFTVTLRGMDRAYLGALMLYLGLIALLPVPAAMLGEYAQNSLAVALFAVYASAVSAMEVVLLLVAARRKLFVAAPSAAFRRQSVLGSLTPVIVFLTSIPLAFFNPVAAMVWWVVGSMAGGFLFSRFAKAAPPPDDSVAHTR